MTPRFELVVVGYVESPLMERSQAPKQGIEGAPDAWLVLDESMRVAARDLEAGDEVLVLTWLDRAGRDVLEVHPRDDPARPLTGVFSTRSADRPNPIGLHRVGIISVVDGVRILVNNMEALNGTPILDIKPVIKGLAEA